MNNGRLLMHGPASLLPAYFAALLDLNATPLPIQPYVSSSRCIGRCMSYISSSSRLVINPYEEFMPIAYTSYPSGSASGSKESGITFLSMHEMNDKNVRSIRVLPLDFLEGYNLGRCNGVSRLLVPRAIVELFRLMTATRSAFMF
jgi:hypothetical protein